MRACKRRSMNIIGGRLDKKRRPLRKGPPHAVVIFHSLAYFILPMPSPAFSPAGAGSPKGAA